MLCLVYISKLSLSGLKTSIENNTKRLIEFLKINHSYSMYGIKKQHYMSKICCPGNWNYVLAIVTRWEK